MHPFRETAEALGDPTVKRLCWIVLVLFAVTGPTALLSGCGESAQPELEPIDAKDGDPAALDGPDPAGGTGGEDASTTTP